MSADGQQRGLVALDESGADGFHEWSDEKQQILQRYVLAPRHQVHLVVHASGRSVRTNEKCGIERFLRQPGRAGYTPLNVVAAKDDRYARLAGERSNLRGAGRIFFEPERGG